VDEIEVVFKKTGKWTRTDMNRPNKHPSGQLKTYNKIIFDFLKNNDYLEKSKVSPDKIISLIPENLQKYFYRGWFDGDGCICISGKSNTIGVQIAGSKSQIWSAFIKLSKKMGFPIHIYRTKEDKAGGSSVNITSQTGQKIFLDYIYNNYENDKIGLSRKYNKYLLSLDRIKNRKISNTGFIGVYTNIGKKIRYYAKVKDGGSKNKKVTYLGFYDSPEEAAIAYDKAAIKRKGMFARTNYPLSNYITESDLNILSTANQNLYSK
jgi:hypothetical protein